MGDLGNAYTPSFNLFGTESLIMEQSEIGKISDMVKDCLRCGNVSQFAQPMSTSKLTVFAA